MAGWGFSVNGEVDLQKYLNFLPLPTYDIEECNATTHYAGFITKDNICAGFTDTNKGPCYVRFLALSCNFLILFLNPLIVKSQLCIYSYVIKFKINFIYMSFWMIQKF